MTGPRLTDTSKRIAYDRYFTAEERNIADTQSLEEAYHAMCLRVSNNVAHAESTPEDRKKYWGKFFDVLYTQDLIPAGRFWANAGDENQQFPNCFVYPIKDTKTNGRDGIFDTLTLAAVTASGGGGTGFDFSRLRSGGVPTTKSKGVASGPVSFLKSYDAVMENIRQGGTRRAANMGILRVDHPDILEFIFLKDKTQKYRRFNISVALTEKFMGQLNTAPNNIWLVKDPKTQAEYGIFIPCEKETPLPDVVKFLTSSHTDIRGDEIPNYMPRRLIPVGDATTEAGFYITPQNIWDCITFNAWNCGDPGLFFIDTANYTNCLIKDTYDIDDPNYIRATNPCGEESMEDNSICMLSSINLANFVSNDEYHKNNSPIDFQRLAEVAQLAVRFLDDSLEVSTYPADYIKEHALATRRIGIGVLGWADMLIKLRVKYGSDESFEIAKQVMSTIDNNTFKASIDLGKERGNFPLFENSCYATGERGFPKVEYLRNSYRTMIAPTGTTSLLTGVNESIEPVFYFSYERKDETGKHTVENYLYKKWHDTVLEDAKVPDYFITTNDIPYEKHISMQAAFQEHVDVSISKTINMPSTSTIEDIDSAYKAAYNAGCKGITIYRDGSKNAQVLNAPEDEDEKAMEISVSREEGELAGLTWKVKTGDGTCFVNISKNGEGKPTEVFIRVGKAGSGINAYSEALGRIISIALQHKVSPDVISKQLIGIQGNSPIFHTVGKYHKVLSVPDAVGKVLEEFLNKSQQLVYNAIPADNKQLTATEEICDDCQQLKYESEGCTICGCGSMCDD